jgi:hypothetical protein
MYVSITNVQGAQGLEKREARLMFFNFKEYKCFSLETDALPMAHLMKNPSI